MRCFVDHLQVLVVLAEVQLLQLNAYWILLPTTIIILLAVNEEFGFVGINVSVVCIFYHDLEVFRKRFVVSLILVWWNICHYKKLRSLKGREGNSRQHPQKNTPHISHQSRLRTLWWDKVGGWSQISPGAQEDRRENMVMIPQEACSLCGYDSLGNPWQMCIHHLCVTYVVGCLHRRGESKHWALFNNSFVT